MKKIGATLLALTLVSFIIGLYAGSAQAKPGGSPGQTKNLKVYVCKYVGTPGRDERLQTGQNPIDLSVNAIKNYQGVGSYFNDRQGRSYVLAEDHGQPEPDVSECPAPDGGPTPSPTSSAPTSDVPTSEVPTSEVPTSEPPTSQVPTSADPTISVPADPTSTAPSSGPVTSPASSSSVPGDPTTSSAGTTVCDVQPTLCVPATSVSTSVSTHKPSSRPSAPRTSASTPLAYTGFHALPYAALAALLLLVGLGLNRAGKRQH